MTPENVPRLRMASGAQGMVTAIEFAIAFNDWAQAQGDRVSVATIRNRWGVSRATAYRWLNAWQVTQERRAA